MTNKNMLITICAILIALIIVVLSVRYSNQEVTVPSGIPNTELKAPKEASDVPSKNSSIPSKVERGDILDPNMKQLEKPEMTIDASKTYKAIIVTDKGNITIDLLPKVAPNTVNNFVYLANNQFYNGVIFHRIIKGFMIQGGDPTGTGTGGPGYSFDDELPITGNYSRGVVAMANAGPNTNGSQFFIMQANTPLPKNYVIFGNVSEGMEVVDAIANAEVKPYGEGSSPVNPVAMKSVEIVTE